jgi:hypothetical protein
MPPLLFLAGCGQSGITFSGTATLDGQPIENGSVTLFPSDGQGPTAGGAIVAGKFTVTGLTPGQKKVKLTVAAPGEVKQVNQRQRMQDLKDERKAAKTGRGPGQGTKAAAFSEALVDIVADMPVTTLEFKTVSAGR